MNNYVSAEKSLKRWLKSRVKITMATVVGFLIAGTVTFGAMADGSYTNDTLTGEVGSTKFIKGHNGNLIINTNGSVGTLLNNLKTSLSKLKEIEKDKNATDEEKKKAVEKLIGCFGLQENGGAVVVGAVAGEGKLNTFPGSIISGVEGSADTNYFTKLAKGLNRINTLGKKDVGEEDRTESKSTNTVIGDKYSPVVIGLVGGDLALGTGGVLLGQGKEKLLINKNGNSTVTINNGNVFGGTVGSVSISLSNIMDNKTGGKFISFQGEAETTIAGDTTLNIKKGANAAGLTAGGIAAAIGGTSVTNVTGDTNIKVNSVVNSEQLEGITTGLFGGGMAVSTLGGKAEANTKRITNVEINNGLSVGVAGGGLAVSTDASQYSDNSLIKKILVSGAGTDKWVIDLDKLPIIEKFPALTISGVNEGGTSTVTSSGDINVNLKGTTAAAGVLGNGIAVSHQNSAEGTASTSTVTSSGDINIAIDVDDSALTKEQVGKIIGALTELNNKDKTFIKKLQDITGAVAGRGIVVGVAGNGVAVARDKGVSIVTAKDITMNLKSGYIVGVAGNGIASGNASSTVKADSSVININGAEVIGVTGSGIALDHGVVKDDAYSKSEIGTTTVNLNSGSADGIFGGGIAIASDDIESRAETITSEKSTINVKGGTADKFGYSNISSIFGTHGSFDKIAEAGKDIAIMAGGVASRNGYTKVAESEINIEKGIVKGDILAGGIAVAGGISEVGTSTINIKGGEIIGSVYGTGKVIAEDNTVIEVDKTKTKATVGKSTLNIDGYIGSLEKIAGFNEINIGMNKAKSAEIDKYNTQLTITDGIDVGTGKLENVGAIIFNNSTANSTLMTVAKGGTVLNRGLIVVDKGDIVVDNTNNVAEDVKNTGKIQVYGITSADEEKFDVKDLFKGKFTNVGMVVGEDGKAILTEGEDVVAGDVTIGEITADATKDNVTLEHVTITDGGTINSDVVNVIGNVTNTTDFEISDGLLNVDSIGNISIADNTEMKLSNVQVNGSADAENGTQDIKFAGEKSRLVLNNSNVKAGVIGENTTNGVVEFTGTENSFDGTIKARNININKGHAVAFGENAVGAGTITLNGDAKIAVGKENTDGVYTQNFFHNSNGNLDVQGTGNIVIGTKNFEGEKVTVDFGENNKFGADLINKLDTTSVYMIKDGEDLKDKKLELVYNTKLYEDNSVLNNINNAAHVVNDKFSDDPEVRKVEIDKHYSSNIYSETVKAAYDNVKMNEEAVESLARKSETGKWTAEGKALYSKNEYDRKGIVGDYSSEIESTGLMAAYGYGLNETTTAGIAFSGVKQDVDTATGSADADLFYLGLYGNKVVGNYDFTAGLGYQFGEYDADNNILAGTGDKYDSQTVSGYVQGRYTADLGDGLSVQPKVKLGYTYVKQDDAKDSYFGVEDAEISTFDAEAGFDVVKSVQLEKSKVDVKFGASYIRTMGDTDEEFTGRFYGAKASEGFNVLGAELAENVVKFNLGAEVTNENGFFYNGGFTYEFGSNDTEAYGVNVGVGYKF